MKRLTAVLLATLALVLMVATVHAEPPILPAEPQNHAYTVNESLPFDAVELAPDERWTLGQDFYLDYPSETPDNVPSSFVCVEVWQRQRSGELWFCGWAFMYAEAVNALHRDATMVSL